MQAKRLSAKAPSLVGRQAGGIGRDSPRLHMLAQLAAESAPVMQQQILQRSADHAGISGLGILQGVLYANPLFQPDTTTLPEFQKLDDKVVTAQTNARKAVTEVQTVPDTKKQGLYKRTLDSKTWGYVVEEQFDIEAESLGWGTQTKIKGGRPDYSKAMGDVMLFADLTTLGQSGDGGPHVGGKLATEYDEKTNQGEDPQWHAADVVHDGAQPGQQPAAIIPNGPCTDDHRYWFAHFRAAGEDGPYDPWREGMKEDYSENLSHGTFYTEFDAAARDKFVATALEVQARVAEEEKRSAKKRRRSDDYVRRVKKKVNSYTDQ